MKNLKSILAIAILAITFTACSSDDDTPPPVNEEEVITTLIANLTSTAGNITMTSRDLDGDGPDAPVITVSSVLAANTTYTGSLDLLNETEDPAESITAEIEDEDDEHQFFFSSSVASASYLDMDDDGNPIGLAFTLTTNDAGMGNLTITLRHEPAKDAEGVSDGNIANAGGETDIAVTFPIEVQ